MGIKSGMDFFEKLFEENEEQLNRFPESETSEESDAPQEMRDTRIQFGRDSENMENSSYNTGSNGFFFCSVCGKRLQKGVAFCSDCGSKVSLNEIRSSEERRDRQISRQETSKKKDEEKKVTEKKGFFASIANALNEEEISEKVAKNPLDLEEYYAKASEDWEKAKLVQNCIIPQDEEKIRQLVMLCEEHIPTSSQKALNRESYEVESAWMGKLEQIYERTRKTIPDKPLFQTVEAVYFERKQGFEERNGKIRRIAEWIKKHSTGLILLAMLVGVIILISSLSNSRDDVYENYKKQTEQFNNKVDLIQERINSGDLDGAMSQIETLSTDEDWQRKKKQELLNSILVLQGKTEGKILIPEINRDTNYSDAITKLEHLGFTNVTAEPADLGYMEKYLQKIGKMVGQFKDGCVLEISVNGTREYLDGFNHNDNEYVVGTYVEPDAKIVIRYKPAE